MDGAEGGDAAGILLSSPVVDAGLLRGLGGDGEQDRMVHSAFIHIGNQAGRGAVGLRLQPAAAGNQRGNGAGSQRIGESMRVKIDNHQKESFREQNHLIYCILYRMYAETSMESACKQELHK